jgi:hypothetical protein
MGLILQGLARVRSITPTTGHFVEITRRRVRPHFRCEECSLEAFLGRERQRAVNG